jgi:hypothetical protein
MRIASTSLRDIPPRRSLFFPRVIMSRVPPDPLWPTTPHSHKPLIDVRASCDRHSDTVQGMKNLPHDPFPSAHCTAGSLSGCPELSSFTAHPSHRLPSPCAIRHVHFLTKPTHFDYKMSLPVPSGSLGRPRHTLRYPADPLRFARYLYCAPRRPHMALPLVSPRNGRN